MKSSRTYSLLAKRKPSIGRIKTPLRRIIDENASSIENLSNLLQVMCDKGLIELVDDSYKVKQTKERELIKRP